METDTQAIGEATILVYDDAERGREAVDELVGAGVRPEQMNVIVASATGVDGTDLGRWELPADIRIGQDRRDLLEGAGIGALAGALWGGEIAVVAGAAGLLALGPIAFGMVYLGFLGGVVALGGRHQVDKSAQYRAHLHNGRMLVVVRTPIATLRRLAANLVRKPMCVEEFPHRLG